MTDSLNKVHRSIPGLPPSVSFQVSSRGKLISTKADGSSVECRVTRSIGGRDVAVVNAAVLKIVANLLNEQLSSDVRVDIGTDVRLTRDGIVMEGNALLQPIGYNVLLQRVDNGGKLDKNFLYKMHRIFLNTIGFIINKYNDLKSKMRLEKSAKKLGAEAKRLGVDPNHKLMKLCYKEAERLNKSYFKVKKGIDIATDVVMGRERQSDGEKHDISKKIIIAPWSDIRKASALAKQQFACLIPEGDTSKLTEEQKKSIGKLVQVILYGEVVSDDLFCLQMSDATCGEKPNRSLFDAASPYTSLITKYCFLKATNLKGETEKSEGRMVYFESATPEARQASLFDSLETFAKDSHRSDKVYGGKIKEDPKGELFKSILTDYKERLLQLSPDALQSILASVKGSQFVHMLSEITAPETKDSILTKAGFDACFEFLFKKDFIELLKCVKEATNLDASQEDIAFLVRLKALELSILMSQKTQGAYVASRFFAAFDRGLEVMGGISRHELSSDFEFVSRVDDQKIQSSDNPSNGIVALVDYHVSMPSPLATLDANYRPQDHEKWLNVRIGWHASDADMRKIQEMTTGVKAR